MKLTKILKAIEPNLKMMVQKEIEFDYLGLSNIKNKGTLCTFIDNEKYIDDIADRPVVMLTTSEIAQKYKEIPAVVVKDPRIWFFKVHNFLTTNNSYNYQRERFKNKIGINCKISASAHIAETNVVIDNNVTIEEFVSIKENTVIKDNVIIRAGTIIGGEGFEQKRTDESIISVEHAGGVVIGKNVEIQQNSCVDKAIFPWDNTVVGEDCKIDNLVHIAHAVKMGERIFVAAHTCVAGRVVIGDDVWIGPGVTIINNINIGNRAKISIGSVVTRSVATDERVTGNFAIEHSHYLKFLKSIR